jgi:hypothetical protein
VQNISIGLDVALVAGETDIEIHRGRHIVDHIVCRQSYVDAVASLAKSRMNFINAGVFDRKSGCTLVRTWGNPSRTMYLGGKMKPTGKACTRRNLMSFEFYRDGGFSRLRRTIPV